MSRGRKIELSTGLNERSQRHGGNRGTRHLIGGIIRISRGGENVKVTRRVGTRRKHNGVLSKRGVQNGKDCRVGATRGIFARIVGDHDGGRRVGLENVSTANPSLFRFVQ